MDSTPKNETRSNLDALCEYWGLSHPEVIGRLSRSPVPQVTSWFLDDVRRPTAEPLPSTWLRNGACDELIPEGGILLAASIKCDDLGVGRLVRATLIFRQPFTKGGKTRLEVSKVEPLEQIPSRLCCFDAQGNLLLAETVIRAEANRKSPEIDELLKSKSDQAQQIERRIAKSKATRKLLTAKYLVIRRQINEARAEAGSAERDLKRRQLQINTKVQEWINTANEQLEKYSGQGLIPDNWRSLLDGGADPAESLPALSFAKDLSSDWPQLVSNVHGWLYSEGGLVYERSMIETLVAAVRTHDLIVLAGLPGSGKTHIVSGLAKAIGATSRIIPVKPNWTSSEDLIGYYNPVERYYAPTPFLDALVEASRNTDRLFFICLDEMNLARVEYYFADFLSLLENRKAPPELKLYPSSTRARIEREIAASNFELFSAPLSLKIFPNVRFIGTVNVDETTQSLSPKVLDRAFVLRFESALRIDADRIRAQIETYDSCERVLVTPSDLVKRSEYPRTGGEDSDHPCSVLRTWARDYLLDLGVDIGFRTLRQALHYHSQLRDLVPAEEAAPRSLDDVLRMKVLPRLAFDGRIKARADDDRKQGSREKKAVFDGFLHAVRARLGECVSVREMRMMRHVAQSREDEFNYWT